MGFFLSLRSAGPSADRGFGAGSLLTFSALSPFLALPRFPDAPKQARAFGAGGSAERVRSSILEPNNPVCTPNPPVNPPPHPHNGLHGNKDQLFLSGGRLYCGFFWFGFGLLYLFALGRTYGRRACNVELFFCGSNPPRYRLGRMYGSTLSRRVLLRPDHLREYGRRKFPLGESLRTGYRGHDASGV